MLALAVDLELLVEREGHSVGQRTKLFDLLRRARLLPAELVARKAEDHEALVGVLLVQLLEAGVLRREPALGSDVDQEQGPCPCARRARSGRRREC